MIQLNVLIGRRTSQSTSLALQRYLAVPSPLAVVPELPAETTGNRHRIAGHSMIRRLSLYTVTLPRFFDR
jgi:hypothetical protein